MSPIRVYRAATCVERYQFWGALVTAIGLGTATLIARSEGAPGAAPEWFTWQTVFAVCGLMVNIGFTWGKFDSVRVRVTEVENAHRQLAEKVLPLDYARRDLVEQKFETLRDLITEVAGRKEAVAKEVSDLRELFFQLRSGGIPR